MVVFWEQLVVTDYAVVGHALAKRSWSRGAHY